MPYVIKLNEEQMKVVLAALDNFARMGMGQLDVSVDEFIHHYFGERFWSGEGSEYEYKTRLRQEVKDRVDGLKALVWDHSPTSSYGIFNEKVPVDCREAYDIMQVLRKVRAAKIPGTAWTVDSKDYCPANSKQPPVKCEWEDG